MKTMIFFSLGNYAMLRNFDLSILSSISKKNYMRVIQSSLRSLSSAGSLDLSNFRSKGVETRDFFNNFGKR